ncbi:Fungal trichothecene efflux pump [Coniochaeta hoffmannii]|uniref:Fungal trichothecene efflux pump n=1 Tax=Coniochaeta hoffmannii TaxID=91930 RepID=A0AA38VBR0_9PEZI|nr:Fungal trichothecene efflux pump [Coniochaeta hoffmannii]
MEINKNEAGNVEVLDEKIYESQHRHHREDDASSIRSEALGDDLPPGYFYSVRFVGALTGFCLSAISAYIFLLMPTNVLTYINADIGPSAYISWVNIARTLALSFTYTILGRLSDLFGRRWFFIGGNFVALLGIIVCATAQSVDSLIVGSAIYGLGETVQLSFNVALGELVPNKYRPAVLSFVFLTNAPFATFGPIIARKMMAHPGMGWRWTYYINIITVALAIVLLFFFYHPPTFELLHERKTKRQLMKQLDYLGIFLWTAGLTLFLMGISWGGVIYPWKSAAVISSIVIGFVLLVVLFVYEAYANLTYPAIPVKFFANRGFISLVTCATVASMFYYSAVLLWPQQIQALFTKDVNYAGWLSCTVGASTALGQIMAGVLIKWAGNIRYWIIFSTMSMVGFVGALAALDPGKKTMGIALTIVGPFFVGCIELLSMAVAPLFLKPADIGLASGLLASIRSAGGSVAVAVYSTILTNRLATTLPANIGPVAIAAGLPADKVPALAAAAKAGKLASFPGITDAITKAVAGVLPTAYSQAFQTVYLASLGFGGIAIVGCMFSKDARSLLTDRVERKMHGAGAHQDPPAKSVDA